jgi:iron complex transport system substrate-binding protein
MNGISWKLSGWRGGGPSRSLGACLRRALGALGGVTVLLVFASAAGAQSPTATATAAKGPLTLTDDTGETLVLAAPAQRIVSLAPGATEMLFAAGAGDRIVATVMAADEPAAAKKILRIGDANALNYERLVALKPDAVVVWEDLTNRLVVESLRKIRMPLYFIRTKALADIPKSVRQLGRLAGTGEAAEKAAKAMDARIAAIGHRKVTGEPLRVFYMIWDEPLYTVGGRHVISDAIARCGGRNIFDDIAFPAPIVEMESVVKRDPDVMLLSAPPITARDWRERWGRYSTIRAVQTRQILTFSDTRLDRMGSTAIDAVEDLCVQLDLARKALAAPAAATVPAAPRR